MKFRIFSAALSLCLTAALCAGCGSTAKEETAGTATSEESSAVVTAETVQVVQDGMEPISGSEIKDGVYDITVDPAPPCSRSQPVS